MNLANDLVQRLSTRVRKFGIESVEVYYNMFDSIDNKLTVHTNISNLFKAYDIERVVERNNVSGRVLGNGFNVLAIPITQICHLSIRPSHIRKDCKLAKRKSLDNKGTKTDPKNFKPIVETNCL